MPLIIRSTSSLVLTLALFVSFSQDTLREQYRGLAAAYDTANYQYIIENAYSLIDAAAGEGNKLIEAQASALLGLSYSNMPMNATERVGLLEKALSNIEFVESKYEADIHRALSVAYTVSSEYHFEHRKDHFKISDSLVQIAMGLYLEAGVVEDIIRGYRSASYIRHMDDDYINNFKFKMKAYDLALQHGYTQMRSLITNIASVYNTSERYTDAIGIIEDWLKQVTEEDIDVMYAATFQNLAYGYLGIGEIDKAIHYYKKAINLVTGRRNEAIKIWTYELLAKCYYKKQQWDSLQYWINEGDRYFDENNKQRTKNYLALYKGYVALNEGDYQQAEKWADVHLKQCEDDNWEDYLDDNHVLRHELYREWGKPEVALFHFEEHVSYRDSVKAAINSLLFEDYKLQVKTAEQRLDILELENDVQAKNQRLALALIALLFAIVLGAYFIHRYRSGKRIAVLELQNKELENEKIKEDLQVKEQQLSDHTTSMLMKNQAIDEVDELLSAALKMKDGVPTPYIAKMKRQIASTKSSEENWDKFLKYFGAVHSEYFDKLNREFGNLSRKELKHCALIKMNMSLKESASILGVNPESVKVARYRLKKRISPKEDVGLHEILSKI